MEIERIEEFFIGKKLNQKIEALFKECFPDYPSGRTFFKQLPNFRFLAWEDETLIGHLAVEHRIINVDGQLFKIFGIADLCVKQAFQSQKIASQLIYQLQELGKYNRIDFLVLIANDHRFYLQHDFLLTKNTCRWVLIQNFETLGIAKRKIPQSLMVKSLNNKDWPSGIADFLGYVF